MITTCAERLPFVKGEDEALNLEVKVLWLDLALVVLIAVIV